MRFITHLPAVAVAGWLGWIGLFSALSAAESGREGPDWFQIITSRASVRWAEPQAELLWRKNFWKAMKEAQAEDRPIFVSFRCLPCKQCADFDQAVLEGGPLLSPLLKRFITVRLTNAEHIDFRVFPAAGYQDFDLSWWGYFLSPEGRLYGVFGGKDHEGVSTRISIAALANTMERVLNHHHDPRREKWGIDGPVPELGGRREIAFDLPGWKSWQKRHLPEGQGCLHCHQVVEIMRQPAIEAGTFRKEKDLTMWPLPENVGIHLDRDHGLLVERVERGSPAEAAGLKPGDELAAAGGHRLFSQTDFRGVLHRGPREEGKVRVYWVRGGVPMVGDLSVRPGWRETILSWRMSVSQGNIGAGPGFFPIRGRALGDVTLAKPFFGKNTSTAPYQAGMRPHHVILKVNGEQPPNAGREFLVWFRQRFDPGDEVVMTVDDRGEEKEFKYRLVEKNH